MAEDHRQAEDRGRAEAPNGRSCRRSSCSTTAPPREFVVQVLKAVFRMNVERAYHVMMTAHRRGACVITVCTQDVADTKAKEATELGQRTAIRSTSPPTGK